LQALKLIDVIKNVAQDKPFLGICLGMQALLTDSEENGGIACLNLFPGHVRHFAEPLFDEKGHLLKVPHMGWNRVRQKPHPLWQDIAQDSRFYFVHSYYAIPDNEQDSIASSDYPQPFTCALAKN